MRRTVKRVLVGTALVLAGAAAAAPYLAGRAVEQDMHRLANEAARERLRQQVMRDLD